MEVQVFLQGGEIDAAHLPHLVLAMFFHQFAGPQDDPADAGFAHEHVMGLFRQHEAAGARERIKAAFRQGGQLKKRPKRKMDTLLSWKHL